MEKHTISALIIAGATLLIGIVQALVLRAARKGKEKKPSDRNRGGTFTG